jgi:hypothetical protein
MQKTLSLLAATLLIQGCITVPVTDYSAKNRCELSTDRKTLKVIDLAEETNSYYSISGYVLSPILIPTSAILSGTYVLVNNTYNLGEEALMCNAHET